MIIEDSFLQRSSEWFQAKAGVPGASSFNKIITTSGQPSKQAAEYAYQLAGERLLGRCEDTYTSYAMQRGIDLENEARQYYELVTGNEVYTVALVYKNEKKEVACSPDGLTGNSGLEIKCPLLKTHIKYLLGDNLPIEYFTQVQGSMWVCGLKSWIFMSYYPGLKPLILTVKRDDAFCEKLGEVMAAFIKNFNEVYQKLKGE